VSGANADMLERADWVDVGFDVGSYGEECFTTGDSRGGGGCLDLLL